MTGTERENTVRYDLKTAADRRELDAAPVLRVAEYRWLEGYAPTVTAQAVLVRNEGFYIRMICLENHPKIVYTVPDSPVCRDSCMEVFVNFAPERDSRYLNLEANALGTLHCKVGAGRRDRRALRDMGVPMPQVSPQIREGEWRLEFFIPMRCVEAVYGPCAFEKGSLIRANFYKCGDDTDRPHYGMWSPVDSPVPDFHRPEFFGELIIV